MAYYSVIKRNNLSGHKKTRRNLKSILQSERSQSENATLWTSPAIWHVGIRQNDKDRKKYQRLPRVTGEEGMNGEAQRIFRAVKVFSTAGWWWIQVLIYLSQPTECTPKVNPHVN